MADMSYPEGTAHAPPPGGVRIYPPAPVSIFLVVILKNFLPSFSSFLL